MTHRRITPKLENFRKRTKVQDFTVDSATKAVRLRYIGNYLDWLAFEHLKDVLSTSDSYSNLEVARKYMSEALEARIPIVRNMSFLGKREGLSHEQEKRLRQVINPQSQLICVGRKVMGAGYCASE